MRLDIQKFADAKIVIDTILDTTGLKDDLDELETKIKPIVELIKGKFEAIGKAFSDALSKGGKNLKGIATKIIGIGKVASSVIAKIIMGTIKFGAVLISALGIVALLGLAFFAIVQAIDKVKQEHTELSAQVQYIVYALKTLLAPVIEWIGNIIAKIIQFAINGVMFILVLISRITGRALPSSKDFADSMKSAESSSKGTAKNAKEINKQLAGFDEMNTLQDNKSGGDGGIGGGISSTDFSAIDDAISKAQSKVDEFVEKWKERWEKVKKFFNDFGSFFSTLKFPPGRGSGG